LPLLWRSCEDNSSALAKNEENGYVTETKTEEGYNCSDQIISE
jgi:hypothetical protein